MTAGRHHFPAGRPLLVIVLLVLLAGHVALLNAVSRTTLTVAAVTIVAIAVLKFTLWRYCRRLR